MNSGKYSCSECIWHDICDENTPCEDMALSNNDSEIDEIIESERAAFIREWNKYIEYDD